MLDLKLSNSEAQGRLEGAMHDLGWAVVGRSVSERRELPPLLSYQLAGPGDPARLLERVPNLGYGLTREPEYRRKGGRSELRLTVRQLVPTQAPALSAPPREFGRG